MPVPPSLLEIHTHTLSEDASVLVVENRDTTIDNSPFCLLSDEQKHWLAEESRRLWNI